MLLKIREDEWSREHASPATWQDAALKRLAIALPTSPQRADVQHRRRPASGQPSCMTTPPILWRLRSSEKVCLVRPRTCFGQPTPKETDVILLCDGIPGGMGPASVHDSCRVARHPGAHKRRLAARKKALATLRTTTAKPNQTMTRQRPTVQDQEIAVHNVELLVCYGASAGSIGSSVGRSP